LIGQREGIGEGGRLFGHTEQVLVWDDQQGVHRLEQFRDACFGKAHTALALEVEWLGDYTDGENAKLTRGLSYNRRCPGAGTTAHAGSNEHHVCAGQLIAERISCLFRRRAPHFWLRAGAKALAGGRQPVARACQIMTQNKAAPASNPSEPMIVVNSGPTLNVNTRPMSVIGVATTNIQNW
jgi:hypothetical protein